MQSQRFNLSSTSLFAFEMRSLYAYILLSVATIVATDAIAQNCPPPGFPNPGNNCPEAPILCETLDGYCAGINANSPNNPAPTIPGCGNNWVLNNDDWFGFYAGSTTIRIRITPSNCTGPINTRGLQGGIYSGCPPGVQVMDVQCPCTTQPFILESTQFVIGQVYFIFLDGCGNNTCNYLVEVIEGETEGESPEDPDVMTGPIIACQGGSGTYTIPPPYAATIYTWTVTPSSMGTVSGSGPSATVNWGNTPGTAEVCVTVANQCFPNDNPSCTTVEVIPEPTATLSGSGIFCANSSDPIDLSIEFTGDPEWIFTYAINGVAQPPITTGDNPYILTITDPGTYSLVSVRTVEGNCPGMVSGNVTITRITLNPSATTTPAVCGQDNGAINLSVTGGTTPYTFEWDNGETTEDLSNIPPGGYTVTITDANGCTETLFVTLDDSNIPISVSGTTTPNTTCDPAGNGNISTTVTPTNNNYTYEWSTGETTPNLNNVPPGSYTVTVTFGVNCTAEQTFTIQDQPIVPTITPTVVGTTCDLGNGSISISISGGVPPYTILWEDGQTTTSITDVVAGSYSVTVTGANDCTAEATVTVPNNNPPINITSNITPNTTCLPGGNGSINISVSPPGTYTYEWSNGETDEDLINFPPGSYTVTVSGGGSCTAEATFEIPDQPNEPTVSANTTPSTCELDNGSITTSVSGGVPPYTFEWDNGATTPNITDAPAGSYSVTVTGANGCTTVGNFTISNNNPPFNINPNIQPNTTCLLPGNGSVSVTVTPAGNYTYEWSNGATTPNITNQPAGSYTVTVSAGGACTQELTIEIPEQPIIPVIAFNPLESTCDLSNGSISVSVSGGVPPYTFEWSNGSTTQNINNIPAGSYSLTVTGANGCTAESSVDLGNNNPPFNISANVTPNTTCLPGGNGSINITVVPAANYTYEWSNGATTEDINGLPPGSYTVTVSAGGSCTAEATFDIPDEPNEPTVNANITDARCEQNNGSINTSVTGSFPPYTYAWDNGASTPNLTNIATGDYTVTVTGANGCSTIATFTVGNDNPPFSATANIQPNTTCLPLGNGSVSITVLPSNTYTFNWSTGASTQNITNLPGGSYTVTISAGGACIEEFTFDVPDEPNNPNPFFDPIESTCELSNGSIGVSVVGGVSPYTFNWSNGATNQNLTNIPAGFYTLTVTGANGCTNEAFVDLGNNNPPIDISGTTTDNSNCLTTGNGSITITVFPTGSYTFNWSHGPSTQNVTGLSPGSYTVTVSSGGACTAEATFDVGDDPFFPELSFDAIDPNCGLSNGRINLSVTAGLPPYTYLWSTGATTQNLLNVPAGLYFVTVTGVNGCSSELAVDLNNQTIDISVFENIINQTSCVSNNGSVSLTVSPNNLTFLWSNGATSANLNNVPAGTYTVTVSAGGDCTVVESYTVEDDREYPILSLTADPSSCGFNNGSVILDVFNGPGPYSYNWSNGSNQQNLNNVPTGAYSVTVTTGLGCTATDLTIVESVPIDIDVAAFVGANNSCGAPNGYIDLDIDPPGQYTYSWSHGPTSQNIGNLGPGTYTVVVSRGTCSATASYDVVDDLVLPNANASSSPATCGQPTGSVTLSVSGASPPYTFLWSNGGNTQNLNNVPPGTYTVTVTDLSNCTTTATATVGNTLISPNISGTPSPNTSCSAPNGSININVTPAGPAYSFAWSNFTNAPNPTNLASGNYTVTVSFGVGCSATSTLFVPNNTVDPVINAAIIPSICGQSDGGINLTITGGSSPYAFNWSNGAATEDLSDVLAGNYTVTVTDANGCTADSLFNVPNNSSTFSISGVAAPVTSCLASNGSIDLTITPAGPYTYQWSNGETTQDLNNLPPGTYTVTVVETGTCEASASFVVADNRTFPSANIAVTPDVCNLLTGAANLSVSGGAQPYTYAWSNGASSEDLTGIASGTYEVTVTGANGCTASASAVVTLEERIFSLSGSTSPNSSCTNTNGAVDLVVNPPGTYTYTWSNGATTEDISAVLGGTYSVTVSAGGTCTNTATFTVQSTIPAPLVSGTITPELCGRSNGSINISVGGTTGPFTFSWSNGAVTEDISSLPGGNYAVTVTGSNGCSSAQSYTVPNNTITPAINASVTNNTSCSNPNGAVVLAVSPSSLTYTYQWSTGQTTSSIVNLTPGTYTVTVSGGGACTETATYTINNNANVPVIAGATVNILCFGDKTGAIDQTITGGTPPFSINWSPSLPGNPVDPSGLAAGTYSVTITDPLGCSATRTYTITQPATAVSLICVQTATVSIPGAIDGIATVTLNGGTPPYAVSVNPGSQQSGVAAGSLVFNNLAEGPYTVTVTDANGCPADCGFAITPEICETTAGAMSPAAQSLCGPGCLTAVYNAAGQFLDPDDVLQFILHQGNSNIIVNELSRSTQPTFCFDPATMAYGNTYYISAVIGDNDGNGNVILSDYCTVVTIGSPITFYEEPVASIATPAPLNCAVDQVVLSGESSVTGSVFEWSTANGVISGSTNQSSILATAAGTYTLVVTSNGCTDTQSVVVRDLTNQPTATVTTNPDDLLNCRITQITLSGTIEGSLDANSIWFSGNNVYANGTTVNVDQPGTYVFVIVDTISFCRDTAIVVIGQDLAFPPLFINPPGILSCTNPSITLSGGSAIAGVNFSWTAISGNDTLTVGSGSSVVVNTPGTYILTGVDPTNNCTNSTQVSVTAVLDAPVADAGSGFTMLCFGDTAMLNGTGSTGQPGLAYSWTTNGGLIAAGANTATPTILQPGTYTLVVTNPGNGCTDQDIVVIDPDAPVAQLDVIQPPCEGDRGTIRIESIVGGKPPIRYSFDGGSTFTTQNLFANLVPGTYSVLAVDALGCSATASATIVAAEPLLITLQPEVYLDLGDSYQITTVLNVPANTINQVRWTPSTGLSCDDCLNPVATPPRSQRYKIQVVSTAGCRAESSILIIIDRRIDVYVPNVFSPDNDGFNDWFTIFANPKHVLNIKTLQVFDRWGSQVFQRDDFAPNIEQLGWDGAHRGSALNPAVFVWYAELELADGTTQIFKGDVTLVR